MPHPQICNGLLHFQGNNCLSSIHHPERFPLDKFLIGLACSMLAACAVIVRTP
jgi:hypothetical protein